MLQSEGSDFINQYRISQFYKRKVRSRKIALE